MKTELKMTWVLIGLMMGTGCAHSALEKTVDEKIAKQATVSGSEELGKQARTQIGSQADLTEAQKLELANLQLKTKNELAFTREQSLKLRSLLIQDVSESTYNAGEVEIIKKRLRALEDRRLTAIFSAVDEANHILGRDPVQNRRIYQDLYELEGRGGARFE